MSIFRLSQNSFPLLPTSSSFLFSFMNCHQVFSFHVEANKAENFLIYWIEYFWQKSFHSNTFQAIEKLFDFLVIYFCCIFNVSSRLSQTCFALGAHVCPQFQWVYLVLCCKKPYHLETNESKKILIFCANFMSENCFRNQYMFGFGVISYWKVRLRFWGPRRNSCSCARTNIFKSKLFEYIFNLFE